MRNLLIRTIGVVLVASGLLAPTPAQAVSGLWQVSDTWLGWLPKISRPGTQTVSVACPTGSTPVSGQVNASAPDDLRRTFEYVNFGSGGQYVVGLDDETGGGGQISVEPKVRCVPMSYFTNAYNTGWQYFSGSGNLRTGTVTCASGWSALSALVNTTAGGGVALLTSTPTIDGHGWTARTWAQFPSQQLQMQVNCVPTADLSALRTFTHTDSVGWGTSASASCPSGMFPINGGTIHIGGDLGAITIHQRATTTGWTSTTESLSTGSIQTVVRCVPTANPTLNLSGPTGVTNQTSATWSFSATDPAAGGGYSTSFACVFVHPGTPTFAPTPCGSPVSYTDMTDGIHQLSVTVTTSDGRKGSASRYVDVDTQAPGVTFADPPDAFRKSAAPGFGFTIDDAHAVPQVECWLDGAPPAACDLPAVADHRGTHTLSLSGVSDGAHVLHVRTTDAATNTATADLPFRVDTKAPVVTMTRPTAPITVALSTTASWSGTDAGSGIGHFETRWMRSPYNGTFGAWSAASTLTATSKVYGSLAPGSTYCFATRATDKAGNPSPYAAARCTAIPLDDRGLTRSAGWSLLAPTGWFRGTALNTSTRGASVTASNATVKRIGLVALACPSCGVVGVYVGPTLIGKIDLAAGTTQRVTRQLPVFSLRTGAVTLRVLSSGKTVRIDALALSRM